MRTTGLRGSGENIRVEDFMVRLGLCNLWIQMALYYDAFENFLEDPVEQFQ